MLCEAWCIGAVQVGTYHERMWVVDAGGPRRALVAEVEVRAHCAALAVASLDLQPAPIARRGEAGRLRQVNSGFVKLF